MNITFKPADNSDIKTIYLLCKSLIDEKYQLWYGFKLSQKQISNSVNEYTSIYLDNHKCGYYHFFRNEDGKLEIDDLYTFPAYQNRGTGTYVIKSLLNSVNEPVMLYVFSKTKKPCLYTKDSASE